LIHTTGLAFGVHTLTRAPWVLVFLNGSLFTPFRSPLGRGFGNLIIPWL
jgi:hypothetical protein